MRYQVNDLPANAALAFTPIPAVDPIGGMWGDVQVWGSPGTDPIAAPSPMGNFPSRTSQTGVNSARPSDVAPDVAYPSTYVALADGMGPSRHLGMWRRRFAELPVPAVPFNGIAQSVSFITKKGGRKTQAWPRAFQRFPTGP